MNKRYILIAMSVFPLFALPGLAAEQPAAPVLPAEGPLIGLGAKGRLTQEQAQIVALQRIPGTLIFSQVVHYDRRLYYQNEIATATGSIYDVVVSADTGEIFTIDVVNYVPGTPPPEPLMSSDMAKMMAESYVQKEMKGVGKPKIYSVTLGTLEKRFVYRVAVRHFGKTFDVVINAYNGKIIKTEGETP